MALSADGSFALVADLLNHCIRKLDLTAGARKAFAAALGIDRAAADLLYVHGHTTAAAVAALSWADFKAAGLSELPANKKIKKAAEAAVEAQQWLESAKKMLASLAEAAAEAKNID